MAATDLSCTTFSTHSVPDITRNDTILAICTVPQPYCQPDSLAFHVEDFAAFKSLFSERLPPDQQAWLSACDPRHLPALHHSTKNVGGAFDHGVEVVQDTARLMELFVEQLKVMAHKIRFRDAPCPGRLVILICGPTSPQQDMLKHLPYPLSSEDTAQFLYIEDFRELVGHGVDSMLITPCMHAGGWIVNDALTRSKPLPLSAQRQEYILRRVLRNTAPFFVDSSFAALTKEDSIIARPPSPYENHGVPSSPTMPKGAFDAYKKFYGTIHEACFSSLVVAPRMSSFNFTVDLDNWGYLCGPRRGPSLIEHAQHWKKLPIREEPSISRSPFPFYNFGTVQASQLMHLKMLAFILRHEWQRDESDRGNQELQEALDKAFELSVTAEGMDEDRIELVYLRFIQLSVYRQALMSFADAIVHICGFESLQSRCFRWPTDDGDYKFGFELDNPDLSKYALDIRNLLPVMPSYTPRLPSTIMYGRTNEGFTRPASYLWRLIAVNVCSEPEANLDAAIQKQLQTVVDVLNELRHRMPGALISHSPWVAGAGYSLFSLLGKSPDSARLRIGLLTKDATGIGPMPSEIMQLPTDPTTNLHANWRGSSRRAGGNNIRLAGPGPTMGWTRRHMRQTNTRPCSVTRNYVVHERWAKAPAGPRTYPHACPQKRGVDGTPERTLAAGVPESGCDPETSDEFIRRHEQQCLLQVAPQKQTAMVGEGRGQNSKEEGEDLINFSDDENNAEPIMTGDRA